MQRLSWIVCIGLVATASVLPRAQGPPAAQAPGDQPTFRAGVRLATFDAVVTDDKGRHVTDLTAADFEVVERGKRQTVRQAAYVPTTGPPAATAPPTTTAPPDAMPGRAGLAVPERTARVLAIVVDDLLSDLPALVRTRQMLTRYLDTMVAPGDLVAILRASGGSGALQQFTSDRRLLAAAIERVRWVPRAGSGDGGFSFHDEFLGDLQINGVLGALEYAVRGVAPLPGRKAVVFVSEWGAPVRPPSVTGDPVERLNKIIDRANRGGVAIYPIDPGGLTTQQLTAADLPAGPGSPDPTGVVRDALIAVPSVSRMNPLYSRREMLRQYQHGLEYLADRTGGIAVINSNDLVGGLARIIEHTRGYYLIGFDTAIAPGARIDPDDVRIRLKRKGLRVRARQARFGPADPDARPEEKPADPLVAAILSPFTTGAIGVRLTTIFGHDSAEGSYVRTLVAIDPAGLTLTPAADGPHEGDLSLLALAVDRDGQIIGEVLETVAVRLDADAYARARQRGLRYGLRVPLKTAGGYQIRVAVRDDRSKALGTAAEFVEIPRVGKDRLALSGVVLAETDAPAAPLTTIFAPGRTVEYRCTVYDGRTARDRALSTRATVLRDGRAVHTSPPAPITGAAKDAPAVAPVAFRGSLNLGDALPAGAYTLQLTVAEDGSKAVPAIQWVDFEVR
ncbi:MAG: VWA domain-containing protein [Vicinamibacteria bacterium]